MQFLIALALGGASAFAFQPVGWWPLMIVAMAALCELIARAGTIRRALLVGWGFGLGQFAIGLSWIATAFTFQAAMPTWLGWVAVVLLSLYLAVYPMLAAGLAWRFGQESRVALVLALAGAWAIAEWLRASMFTGFAWNPIGVTLADTPALQWATSVGTYGLSALVASFGGLLWLAINRDRYGIAGISAFGAILVAMYLLPVQPSPTTGRNIRVIQPNIGQQDKWRPGFDEISARILDQLTIQGRPVTRLIFWPEAAVTDPMEDGRTAAAPLGEAQRLRATRSLGPDDVLLTGGLSLTSRDGQIVDGATNSIYVMSPLGRVVGRYDKAHLVPYGEYLPMRSVLSAIGLSRLAPGDLDFAAGPGPRTIQLPGGWGKVGLQLCYEIIFSGEVVDRKNRPDFIFNPSNDAWFGRWGPPQHLAQARLRAAEERLPIIRSTPTGISAVIDSHGRVIQALPWQTAGVIDARLPARLTPTMFARLGNVIPLTLGFLLLIAAIALDRRARYRRI
jgi:apolipoprotein N-acyltransferase